MHISKLVNQPSICNGIGRFHSQRGCDALATAGAELKRKLVSFTASTTDVLILWPRHSPRDIRLISICFNRSMRNTIILGCMKRISWIFKIFHFPIRKYRTMKVVNNCYHLEPFRGIASHMICTHEFDGDVDFFGKTPIFLCEKSVQSFWKIQLFWLCKRNNRIFLAFIRDSKFHFAAKQTFHETSTIF